MRHSNNASTPSHPSNSPFSLHSPGSSPSVINPSGRHIMTGREDPPSRNAGADPDPDPEPPVSTASASGALPASSSPDLHRRNDDDDRDALELHEIETHEDDVESWSSGSISSGEYRVTTRRTISRSSQRTEPAPKLRTGFWGRVQRFWTRNVVMTVPQKNNRDHFGKSIVRFVWCWVSHYEVSISTPLLQPTNEWMRC